MVNLMIWIKILAMFAGFIILIAFLCKCGKRYEKYKYIPLNGKDDERKE